MRWRVGPLSPRLDDTRKRIRTALVGCGKVGHTHARALTSLPGSQLVAVCDPLPERATAFGLKYGARPYTDLSEMLDKERLGMVSICTPHPAHADAIVQCAAHCVNALVEKPLAADLGSCDRAITAARRAGVKLGVISQRRLYQPVVRMRQAIDSGAIGTPVMAELTVLGWRDHVYYRSDPWRGWWDSEGGGVMVNQTPHQLDLLQWMMGPVEEVFGYWDNLNHPYIEVEDTAVAVIRFRSGALGSVVLSNSQKPGLYGRLHIHGSNGASIGVQTEAGSPFVAGVSEAADPPITDLWTVPGDESLLARWQAEDRAAASSHDVMTYYHELQIADFLGAIDTGRSPAVDGNEGRKVVEIFTAIYRAQRDGRPVRFPVEAETNRDDFDGRRGHTLLSRAALRGSPAVPVHGGPRAVPDQAPVDLTPTAGLWKRAKERLPGGVTASARLHPSLGRPFLASRAKGSRVWDVDGREFIDFNMSYGAALLGHAHPAVTEAVTRAAELGIMCGYETEYQTRLAERLAEVIPSAELIRFAGSGTETTWHALRTARVATGRPKVVKFEGHFHGYNDSLGFSFWPSLDTAGPSEAPHTVPESAGIPAPMTDLTIVLPWNDVTALEAAFGRYGSEIAAVVMEPVNHDSGTILPMPGYLDAVRELTSRNGSLLIFDEILSGFRTGPGGAQQQYGVTPDLTTLGKALGGGTALSAFVGSREAMAAVAPLGRAVHSGTYNAHLVPILAGLAFLEQVTDPTFYPRLRALEDFFYPELQRVFDRAGVMVRVQSMGARFSLLFGLDDEPHNYRDVVQADTTLAHRFYGHAMEQGVYFHASWHHGFSAAHTKEDLTEALERIEIAARRLVRGGA